MLNQVILVGEIVEIKEKVGSIVLKVSNSNIEDRLIQRVQEIPILLDLRIIEDSIEFLKVGSTIGIKASLGMNLDKLIVFGEKITFIKNSKV